VAGMRRRTVYVINVRRGLILLKLDKTLWGFGFYAVICRTNSASLKMRLLFSMGNCAHFQSQRLMTNTKRPSWRPPIQRAGATGRVRAISYVLRQCGYQV
jgi:hypothetical protein